MNLKHLLLSLRSARHSRRGNRRFALHLVAVAALALVIAFPAGAAPGEGAGQVGRRRAARRTPRRRRTDTRSGALSGPRGHRRRRDRPDPRRSHTRACRIDRPGGEAADPPARGQVRREELHIRPGSSCPTTRMYAAQWHLPQILAPQAWDLTQGAPGVVIAILDSGVDPYHPDLAPKLVAGYNTYSNNTNTAGPIRSRHRGRRRRGGVDQQRAGHRVGGGAVAASCPFGSPTPPGAPRPRASPRVSSGPRITAPAS